MRSVGRDIGQFELGGRCGPRLHCERQNDKRDSTGHSAGI